MTTPQEPDAFFNSLTTENTPEQQKEIDSYIAEYLRANNKETWIVKLRTLLKSIPDALLSEISVQGLTSSAPVFR